MDFLDEFIVNHPYKDIVINNIKRNYLVGGTGNTALVIFPGGGQDALSCYDLIDAFENKYKVISINYDHLRNLQEFYDYVNAILSKEHIQKLTIYGLSIGGFLAQHYLRNYKERISKVIISHAGTTKSKTIITKVAIPGKILHFFLPIIPVSLFRKFLTSIGGKIQSGQKNVKSLYKNYSTKKNYDNRVLLLEKSGFNFLTRDYLESIYHLGIDMQQKEKKFRQNDLKDWKGKILILRTDNDPLAQDDGMFKVYYPQANVITFTETGHLTPFVRFEEMVIKIDNFLK
jgi:pimeloyl-ACP methyl ester carboxylesterase